ncbi:hypothetical protein LIA77_03236 [Sarocladium implicatum]|nr:hypothetical protein LIA77_03236 [Sarocladium implicatum]
MIVPVIAIGVSAKSKHWWKQQPVETAARREFRARPDLDKDLKAAKPYLSFSRMSRAVGESGIRQAGENESHRRDKDVRELRGMREEEVGNLKASSRSANGRVVWAINAEVFGARRRRVSDV